MVFLKNTNLLILHGSQGQQLLLKQICPKEVHGRHDKVKEIFSYNTECSVGNKFWAVHPDTSTYNMNKGFKLTKSNFFHPLILSIAVIMLRNFTPFEIQPNKFSRNHNYIKYWKYYHHFSVTDKNQWNINLRISYYSYDGVVKTKIIFHIRLWLWICKCVGNVWYIDRAHIKFYDTINDCW